MSDSEWVLCIFRSLCCSYENQERASQRDGLFSAQEQKGKDINEERKKRFVPALGSLLSARSQSEMPERKALSLQSQPNGEKRFYGGIKHAGPFPNETTENMDVTGDDNTHLYALIKEGASPLQLWHYWLDTVSAHFTSALPSAASVGVGNRTWAFSLREKVMTLEQKANWCCGSLAFVSVSVSRKTVIYQNSSLQRGWH